MDLERTVWSCFDMGREHMAWMGWAIQTEYPSISQLYIRPYQGINGLDFWHVMKSSSHKTTL